MPETAPLELYRIGDRVDFFYHILVSRILFLFILLIAPLPAKDLTWTQTKRLAEFEAARLDLAGHLPQLAIPKLQKLMAMESISKDSISNLRVLLGEAQVRAGSSELALKTLTENSTEANKWRVSALIQLGRLSEAEKSLAKIKGTTALRQRALILSSLDQKSKALALLTPKLSKDTESRLLAISIHLDLSQLEKAEALLKGVSADKKNDPTTRFLNGRLLLGKEDRLAAVGTFQAIVNGTDSEQLQASPAIYHAATVALADSLALGGNTEAAVTSIIETIDKNPDSPRLNDLFSRLAIWIDDVPLTKLIDEWTVSTPPAQRLRLLRQTFDPLPVPSPHTSWSLYLLGIKELKGERPRAGRLALTRLFLNLPDDLEQLRHRSLIALGLRALEEKDASSALGFFKELSHEASNSDIKTIASSLIGTALFSLQDPKQAAAAFSEASTLAARLGDESFANTASLNASLSQLQAGIDLGIMEQAPISSLSLQLERGLLLSNQNNPKARLYLEEFLANFPKHPRLNEAKLALGESYVFSSPVDASSGKKILTGLKFEPSEIDFEARRIEALLDLNQDFEAAEQFLMRHSNHPIGAAILFRHAQALTRTSEPAEAYVRYEKLIETFPNSQLTEPARMLSAQAAFSVGTAAAEERAFQRYQELIDAGGPLSTDAALERARLRIDRGEFEIALQELTPLLAKKNKTPDASRRILVLAAEAASNADKMKQALTFYDQLLSLKDLPIADSNRVSYEKGRVLERLNQPLEALDSYNQVINRNLDPNNTTELEWKWHHKCSLEGALPLLERLQKWRAAYYVALKVSKSGGPSAERAGERAKAIQLEHQLWDVE